MGKSTVTFAVIAGLAACMGGAQAAVIYSDDFESYADDAAIRAPGAWGDAASNGGAVGNILLPAPNGRPGQGFFSSGGADAIHVYPTTPVITDANPLVFEYDYWDYSTAGGDRNTMGIRSTAGTAAGGFFEIGEYNALDSDPDNNGTTISVQGYGFRTVFVGGPADLNGWIPLTTTKVTSDGTAAGPAWHHFKLIIGETYVTASVNVDTNLDGTQDTLFSRTVALTAGAGKTYDSVRWGGPSGNSSTGSAGADNLNIEVIPEPATVALLALGGLLLRGRRRAA